MHPDKMICSIYCSGKKDEMYLYVDKSKGVADAPEALMKVFGEPQHSLDILLTADKKLARAQAAEVMAAIREQGYYLQMPPNKEEYLLDLYKTPVNPTY